jgi:hypothetical protein
MLALAVAGCGGGDGANGPPLLQWYINPDDGGQAEIAVRCTEKARGRTKLNGETKLTEGEEVELAFDPHEVHIVDPVTGTRLTQDLLPDAA